jgi:hypothetical protein
VISRLIKMKRGHGTFRPAKTSSCLSVTLPSLMPVLSGTVRTAELTPQNIAAIFNIRYSYSLLTHNVLKLLGIQRRY